MPFIECCIADAGIVFLRMLEYYHGIMFLTTNRISSFDSAFISRIHLAVHYPPLAQSGRRTLLYTFLKQASQESAEAMSRNGFLEKLAKEQLNGRQLKNLVRTACALALSDDSAGGRISQRHMELALQPMKQFAQTMEKMILSDKLQEPAEEGDENEQQVEDQSDNDAEEGSHVEDGEEDDKEDGEEEDEEEDEEGDEVDDGGDDLEDDEEGDEVDDEDDDGGDDLEEDGDDLDTEDEGRDEEDNGEPELHQSKRRRLV